MAPNPTTASCIVNSMSSLWKDEAIADFTVFIDDSIFKCHRFILGACSRFFYALFTTDMMEKKDNSARLHDVDSSAFELILKVLYTGEDVVDDENVPSVWQCAHRLQITFLVEQCENFAISNVSMNTFTAFSRVAMALDSKSVLAALDKFVLKNFSKIKDDKLFLEYSAEKLTEIIQSDELDVNSEDDVLLLIYKWCDYSAASSSLFKSQNETSNCSSELSNAPEDMSKNEAIAFNVESHPDNQKDVAKSIEIDPEMIKNDILIMHKPVENRAVYLQSLLKASRSCLASPQCLQNLYQHNLTQGSEEAKRVLFDALLYQVKGYHHGYFPKAALHRNSSEFEHVGLIAYYTGSFNALSLARNKWYLMPAFQAIKSKIKLALFDGSIYAVGQADDSTCKLCVLKESSWEIITELPELKYLLLSHKNFLYAFDTSNGKVLRMNPNSLEKTPKKIKHPESFTNIKFALSLKQYILVFSHDSVDGQKETAVHVFNTSDETWHRHVNLDGPAKNMASFQDDDNVYLLQSNGNLWSVTTDDAEIIKFQFAKKIWQVEESLRGALLYKGKLFLFLKLPWVNTILNNVPGVYTSLEKWALDGYASNFICTVRHNLEMVKK